MVLSVAERQRRRRQIIKEDPERRLIEKQKERERWIRRVEKGEIKNVKDMTEREKRHQDVEVKCMHRVGGNRFFWPTNDDVCWYTKDKVLGVIPKPTPVTGRHMQVDPVMWKNMTKDIYVT